MNLGYFVKYAGRSLVIILAASAALCAPSASFAMDVVIATPEEMQGADVQQVNWEYAPHQLLTEPLFHLDPKTSSFVPALASEWKLTDGNELVLTIPGGGRKFPNGKPLTAESVKASFERYLKISPYSDDLAAVESISVDGDSVIFKFNSSPVPAMVSMSNAFGGIVDAEEAERLGDEAVKSGLSMFGPFKIDEWAQGSHIRVVPNENFGTFSPLVKNKGPVKLDSVTVRFIPDNFTRIKELQAGDVHVAYGVPGERVEALKRDPGIALDAKLQTGADILYLQPGAKGLTDLNVRLAILRAIDRSELVKALSGAAEERYGILAPTMMGFSGEFEDEAAKIYSYDADEAARLLDGAGYKPGPDGVRAKDGERLEFTFLVPFDVPTLKQMAPVIQSQLKKIGISLNIREFEDQYVKQTARDGKNEISMRHYSWPDADMLTWLVHTDSGYYNYPDADKLIEEGRKSADPKIRSDAYAIAQREIMKRGIIVPLVSNVEYTAYRKDLKGVVFTPLYIMLNDVTE
jgi:peptide/nickel transport system substrate-binding protein